MLRYVIVVGLLLLVVIGLREGNRTPPAKATAASAAALSPLLIPLLVREIAQLWPDARLQPPSLQSLAADCLPALQARHFQGRLLKLQINQRAQNCNALLETAAGSERYFGLQRQFGRLDVQVLGAVRLPATYRQAGPLPTRTLDWDTILQRDLLALPQQLIPAQALARAEPWAIQVVWMPAPYERAVWMVGHDLDGEFRWSMDVDTDAEVDHINALAPALAEDLADPASAPHVLADREADKLAALALEGGVTSSGTVYESAQWCADALQQYNSGARVLRVALTPAECTLVVEPLDGSGNWLVWRFRGYRDWSELTPVTLPAAYADLPNLTLDPAWLVAQSLQERMQRSGIEAAPRFIGLSWDPGSRDAFWLVKPNTAEHDPTEQALRVDRNGAASTARFVQLYTDSHGDPDSPALIALRPATR
jgi:hypothetical protein